jgi:outer membrane protein assembly factor BamA
MKYRGILVILFFTIFSTFSQTKIVDNIELKGIKKLKESFLRSILHTKIGQVLDYSLIEDDIVLLKRMPAVSHAYYKVKAIEKEKYNVVFYIEENHTLLPDVNFWTTTNEQFAYKVGLYDYNFLGRNIVFGGFYQNNGFDSYGFNFKAPNLFSEKWGAALTVQNWKSKEPIFFGNLSANYLYNNISFEALGLHQINLKNEINFGVNVFTEKYEYISGDTDPTVPLNLELDKVLFKFVYNYNNLKYFYQYISGFKSKLYAQFVTSNNEFQKDFFIVWNDFFYYKRIKKKGDWANRLRLGLSSNENSPFAPFSLDNNVNIRGVGILVDRGTGVAVLNSEYQHTIYDKKWLAIETNVFVDIGSWRDPGGELTDFLKREKVRAYSGIGLRFMSKKIYNATFRIDYGFRVLDERNQSRGGFVFGLGQYF